MSTAHASPDAPASSHAHDEHAFDGEPARTLPADEPPTPSWLPILGLSLFVIAAVAFLATRDAQPRPVAPPAERAAELAPPSPAAPARPGAQAPAPAGSGLGRLNPEQVRNLQKQLEQIKAQQGQQGAAPPPAR